MQHHSNNDVAYWVVAAQHGSTDAFRQLHRRFVAAVHGILLSRFRPAIADELTQECFLLAFRKLGQLREPAKFGPWVVAIARRMDAVNERHTSSLSDSEPMIESPGNVEAVVDAERVLRAIATLPEAYRETLILRLVEGMGGPEIAALTGLSPDSVRVNLHRGMKLLRDALRIRLESRSERA